MMHGTGPELIRRARQEGALVIVEPVNQHPAALNAILNEEAERLGLKETQRLHPLQERQIEESLASDFMLVASQVLRDSFVEQGYDARRMAILPYGVDLERFHPVAGETEPGRPFTVVCVGAISPRKGQIYLLEAWKRLKLPDAELLLIGSISREMRAILGRYEGLFRHIPFVPNQELAQHYSRSRAFVLPSIEDGFGLVSAEAMACGVPVVVTDKSGSAEVVSHGKDGFVVPSRSAEAIAEHIETLYRDRELQRAMSEAALAKARNELGWDKYASRLCDLYRSLPERVRRPEISGEAPAARAS
jgi:glycosyltransferase involved in cell wall biosynthesis